MAHELPERIQRYIDLMVRENPELNHPKRTRQRTRQDLGELNAAVARIGVCPACGKRIEGKRDHRTGCKHWGASLEDIHG